MTAIYQKPGGYFTLFGMDPHFNLDQSLLLRRYLALQKQHHPDKNFDSPEGGKMSAFVNEAYQVLSSDVERARYLVTSVLGQASLPVPDASFLAEILLLREQIESLEGGDALSELSAGLSKRLAGHFADFEKFFVQRDTQSAALLLSKIQYVYSMLCDIENDQVSTN